LLLLVKNSDRIGRALRRLPLYWSDFRCTSF
jgi:hypothetical protein